MHELIAASAPTRDALPAAQQQVTRTKPGLLNLKHFFLNAVHRDRHHLIVIRRPEACRRTAGLRQYVMHSSVARALVVCRLTCPHHESS